MFEGRHIDYRSSKVNTSITDLRRSTHRSSVFEGQHIHLRRSTHRSPKVDTSIFEDRRRKHHTYNSSSNIVHNRAPLVPGVDEVTHAHMYMYKNKTLIIFNIRQSERATAYSYVLTAQTTGPWKTACDSLAQTRETAQIYGSRILITPPTNAYTQYK